MSKKGRKTIEVSIRFFTDGLKEKACWDGGNVYLPKQEEHGIAPTSKIFNRMEEIPVCIDRIMKKQGITIVRFRTETEENKKTE